MVVDALVRAIDRRDEVFQVIEDSDAEEATSRVDQLLGVNTGLHNLGNTRDAVQASTENDRHSEECIGARLSPQ